MSEDFREEHLRDADFLGAFAVMESDAGVLMVQNRRRIGGRDVLTWDLPGGQVEPGEELHAALCRELEEEIAIETKGEPEFLFVQEGLKSTGGVREFAWRSFFFRVRAWEGEPRATSEVLGARWMQRDEMAAELTAPYHDSFVSWLRGGGRFFRSAWAE